jgi:hypothetical protein
VGNSNNTSSVVEIYGLRSHTQLLRFRTANNNFMLHQTAAITKHVSYHPGDGIHKKGLSRAELSQRHCKTAESQHDVS